MPNMINWRATNQGDGVTYESEDEEFLIRPTSYQGGQLWIGEHLGTEVTSSNDLHAVMDFLERLSQRIAD